MQIVVEGQRYELSLENAKKSDYIMDLLEKFGNKNIINNLTIKEFDQIHNYLIRSKVIDPSYYYLLEFFQINYSFFFCILLFMIN